MDDRLFAEWVVLGQRLQATSPENLATVMERLAEVAEAQELLAGADREFVLRAPGSPERHCA